MYVDDPFDYNDPNGVGNPDGTSPSQQAADSQRRRYGGGTGTRPNGAWMSALGSGLAGMGAAAQPQRGTSGAQNLGAGLGALTGVILARRNGVQGATPGMTSQAPMTPPQQRPGAPMAPPPVTPVPPPQAPAYPQAPQAFADGGTVMGPRRYSRGAGLPGLPGGTAGSEPDQPPSASGSLRHNALTSPVSPHVSFGPKPEDMGHHLPTKVHVGRKMSVRMPRPKVPGSGKVSM